MKPQKILVPLDGSALAEAALSTATSVPILLLRAPGAPVAAPGGAATSAPSREAACV
jgi:hypothetical protein